MTKEQMREKIEKTIYPYLAAEVAGVVIAYNGKWSEKCQERLVRANKDIAGAVLKVLSKLGYVQTDKANLEISKQYNLGYEDGKRFTLAEHEQGAVGR